MCVRVRARVRVCVSDGEISHGEHQVEQVLIPGLH